MNADTDRDNNCIQYAYWYWQVQLSNIFISDMILTKVTAVPGVRTDTDKDNNSVEYENR